MSDINLDDMDKAIAIVVLAVIAIVAFNIALWTRMRQAAAARAAARTADPDQPPR